MFTTKALRVAVGVLFLITFAAGGWQAVGAFVLASVALLFVCLGIDGDRGERVWLWLVIMMWVVLALNTYQGGSTNCGPDDHPDCSIRRW